MSAAATIDGLYVRLLNLPDPADWAHLLLEHGLDDLLGATETELGVGQGSAWYVRTLEDILSRRRHAPLHLRLPLARGIRGILFRDHLTGRLTGGANAAQLRTWAGRQDLADQVDALATDVIPVSVLKYQHSGLGDRTLAELFDMRRSEARVPPRLTSGSTVVAPDLMDTVAAWLNRLPTERACSRAFLTRLAKAWPEDPEIDLALGRLRQALLTVEPDLMPLGPLTHDEISIGRTHRTGWFIDDASGPIALFRPLPAPGQPALEVMAEVAHTTIGVRVPALLCDLAFVDEIRDQILTDRGPLAPPVFRDPHTPETDVRLGFRLGKSGGLSELQPVKVTPQKTGFRLKKLDGREALRVPGLSALERKVLRMIELARVLGASPTEQADAMMELAGHPFVFPDSRARLPLPVREVSPKLELASENRWGRAGWRIGERVWSHDDFEQALVWPLTQPQPVGVLVDERRIGVFRAEPRWIHVFAWVGECGGWVPPGNVQPLIERLDGVSEVELALTPELEGRRIPPDLSPRLRLESLDGGVNVSFEVRPLAGGRHLRAGDGPQTLRGRDEHGRWTLVRDLDAERAGAHAQAQRLGLADASSRDLDLEAAVDLLAKLAEAPEAIEARWSGPKTVLTSASASSVRITLAGERLMSLGGALQIDGASVPVADVLQALRDGHRFVRLDGRRIARLQDDLADRLSVLADLSWASRGGEEQVGNTAAPALDALTELGVTVDAPESWSVRIQAMRDASLTTPEIPATLKATLRPYQAEGVVWALRLSSWGLGAVLADDMGLGKTVQALAVLLARIDRGRALVIAPTSVIGTWVREAARFAPDLDVRVYHGAGRADLLDEEAPRRVLVTSWGTLVQDAESLAVHRFSTVVMDEAHAIKNPSTRRAAAARGLQTGFVLALTGTPVENHPTELWSLLRVVAPGLLGSRESFEQRFARPIVGDTQGDARARLSRIVRPFLLRRTKQQVAPELPAREEIVVPVTLTEQERGVYEGLRRAGLGELEEVEADGASAIQILAVLTRLRQAASHAGLVVPQFDDSSKLRAVRRSLADLREAGHRVLVFSQFTSLLDVLAEQLEREGFIVGRLDGRHSRTSREQAVARFQAKELDVFLLSLKAGGVGLNLTAASYVMHLDPWWNPAVQDQATDRAHRIGQDQPVTVLHYIADDTVEVGIRRLQAQKRALVDGLLAGTGEAGRMDAAALLRLVRMGGIAADSDLAGDALFGEREEPAKLAPIEMAAPTEEAEPVAWEDLLDGYIEDLMDRVREGQLRMSSAAIYQRQARQLAETVEGQDPPANREDLAATLSWVERTHDPTQTTQKAWRRVVKAWAARLPAE